MRELGYIASMGVMRNKENTWENVKCEMSLERACRRWKNNVKMYLTQTWSMKGASFHVAQIRSSNGFA